MAKKHTKKEAVSIVISAARSYRDNFAGKRLLFLMTDIICIFEVGLEDALWQDYFKTIAKNCLTNAPVQ